LRNYLTLLQNMQYKLNQRIENNIVMFYWKIKNKILKYHKWQQCYINKFMSQIIKVEFYIYYFYLLKFKSYTNLHIKEDVIKIIFLK